MPKDFADPQKHWPILRRLMQMEDETNSERLKASLSFRKDLLVATQRNGFRGGPLRCTNEDVGTARRPSQLRDKKTGVSAGF